MNATEAGTVTTRRFYASTSEFQRVLDVQDRRQERRCGGGERRVLGFSGMETRLAAAPELGEPDFSVNLDRAGPGPAQEIKPSSTSYHLDTLGSIGVRSASRTGGHDIERC